MEMLRRLRRRFRPGLHPKLRNSVTKAQYDTYFKFAFVRNPWARAYSWYWNVMQDEKHQRSMGITGEMTFEAFLTRYAGKDMLRPQTFWLRDFKGAIPLDFIGRFETLAEDFAACCRRMGISALELPHLRKSEHAHYRDVYTASLKERVATVYREEIEMFGYSF